MDIVRSMSEPMHELPDSIELTREEYRLQHAALEATLDVLDRFPEADQDAATRRQVQTAPRILLRRSGPSSTSSTMSKLVAMETLREATLTLGQAARRLGMTIDGVLQLIYDGTLPAMPEGASGRLLVKSADVERVRQRTT